MTSALGAQGRHRTVLHSTSSLLHRPRRVQLAPQQPEGAAFPSADCTRRRLARQVERCGSATATRGRPRGDGLSSATLEAAARQVQLVSRPPPAQHEPALSPNQARILTTHIKRCTRWEELQLLCDRSGRHFNHINLSAAITHMAQLQQQQQQQQPSQPDPSTSYAPAPPSRHRQLPPSAGLFLDRLLQAAGYNLSGFGTRQLANMLWAVAKTGHRPKPAWLHSVVAAAGSLWGQYEAQHVSNMAYALATIAHDPGRAWLQQLLQESLRLMSDFKPQELSNLAYAASILCERQRVPLPAAALRPWLTAVAARSSLLMHAFDGQELSNLAWALSRMAEASGQQALLTGPGPGPGSDCWMYCVLAAAQERLHAEDLAPQGIACVLLAAARLKHRPPDALLRHACMYSKAVLESPRPGTGPGPGPPRRMYGGPGRGFRGGPGAAAAVFDAQALANLMVGLAQLGYAPPAACMAAFEAAAAARLTAALAAGRRRPAAAAAAPPLLPQHLGNMLWSMSALGWTPGPVFTRLHLLCTGSMAAGFSAAQLAQVLLALCKLRIRVGRGWLEMCCSQMFCSLGSVSSKEAVIILQALAWQRYSPGASWMHSFTTALSPQLPAMPARGLAALLHYLAYLGHRPGACWAAAWAAAAAGRAHEFNGLDAASALRAAALLELPLPAPLAAALQQRLGSGGHGRTAEAGRRRRRQQPAPAEERPADVVHPPPAAVWELPGFTTDRSHLLTSITNWAALRLLSAPAVLSGTPS